MNDESVNNTGAAMEVLGNAFREVAAGALDAGMDPLEIVSAFAVQLGEFLANHAPNPNAAAIGAGRAVCFTVEKLLARQYH